VNTNDATALVHACLREVAPEVDVDAVPADASYRDTLALDSLDFLRLVELLSTRGGIRIDEDDYPKLSTIRDTVAFLASTAGVAGD
jgi:acyl carrier protein